MRLSERKLGDIILLDLAGKLTCDDDSGLLKARVDDLLRAGARHLVVNLGEINYVDSTGLGELVACYVAVLRKKGTVKLSNTSRKMQDLLVITKLLTVFDAYDTESAALASFIVAHADLFVDAA
jgi:anti-sigma B factor antagonist